MSAAQTETTPRPGGSLVIPACLYALALLVIVTLLLGGVMLLNVMGVTSWPSKKVRVRADMRSIAAAVERYRMDTGRGPEQMDSLLERPAGVSGWAGPYLRSYPTDPWGSDYIYFLHEDGVHEVVSYGWDGAPGGVEASADLSSRTINDAE